MAVAFVLAFATGRRKHMLRYAYIMVSTLNKKFDSIEYNKRNVMAKADLEERRKLLCSGLCSFSTYFMSVGVYVACNFLRNLEYVLVSYTNIQSLGSKLRQIVLVLLKCNPLPTSDLTALTLGQLYEYYFDTIPEILQRTSDGINAI
jgi:hypothetical protein